MLPLYTSTPVGITVWVCSWDCHLVDRSSSWSICVERAQRVHTDACQVADASTHRAHFTMTGAMTSIHLPATLQQVEEVHTRGKQPM